MDVNASFPPTVSAYMKSDARHRWILGPFGSGKSVGSQMEILRRAKMQRPSSVNGKRKSRFAVVRNTRPQLKDTTLKTFLDWFPNGTLGTYHSTSNTYMIRQDDIECEIVFRPLDDAADVSNLLSQEYTGAYLNEFRDIKREIVEALDGRIGRYPRMTEGGPSWVGMWGDSNMPEDGSYWHSMLEGFDPDDSKIIKPNEWRKWIQPPAMLRSTDGSYTVNPLAENLSNLPPGYYEHLVEGKTADFIRTFVLCEYGQSHGGRPVHPSFNKDIHVAKSRLIPNKNDLVLIAADFGLTPAIVIKQQNAFGAVCTFDEIVTFGMGIERAIEEKLLPLLRSKRYAECADFFVTGDPSGNTGSQSDETSCADVFRRYRHKGLGRVKLAWSNAPVHRQGATDHFLTRLGDYGRPMYLIDPECTWLIQGLAGKYMFKKHKDGRHLDTVEKNDYSHVCEADEYGNMYYQRGGRRKAEIKERALQESKASASNHYNTPR